MLVGCLVDVMLMIWSFDVGFLVGEFCLLFECCYLVLLCSMFDVGLVCC